MVARPCTFESFAAHRLLLGWRLSAMGPASARALRCLWSALWYIHLNPTFVRARNEYLPAAFGAGWSNSSSARHRRVHFKTDFSLVPESLALRRSFSRGYAIPYRDVGRSVPPLRKRILHTVAPGCTRRVCGR